MYKGNKMNNDFDIGKSEIDRLIIKRNRTDNMVRKRITITIHDIELTKLKKIAKQNKESISGMITRLIQQYKEKK